MLRFSFSFETISKLRQFFLYTMKYHSSQTNSKNKNPHNARNSISMATNILFCR
jgi:hypothetical protein